MRPIRSLAAVLALAALAACADSDDADMDSMDMGSETEGLTQAQIASAADALPCYLRADMNEVMSRPSPLGQTPVVLGDQVGKLCYGAPSANGRMVMDSLVPYGSPWRAGANEATSLHLPFAATIGTVDVDPGSYSLYVIPGEDQWEVMVNSAYERWGIPINDGVRDTELGSFMVTPETAPQPVETLRYEWRAEGSDAGTLVLMWDDVRVPIPVHRRGM